MRPSARVYRYGVHNFNPLIPSGMRLSKPKLLKRLYIISIHSSQAGWDERSMTTNFPNAYFNPLIPSGMRRLMMLMGSLSNFRFQSTHPKRDETNRQAAAQYFCCNFNPLIPSGMRHFSLFRFFQRFLFQSTHPKRDEKRGSVNFCFFSHISIHSSQAGWDQLPFMRARIYLDFNPLIPSGMRLFSCIPHYKDCLFQSTHPKRDETKLYLMSLWYSTFQSTHPKRDETEHVHHKPLAGRYFNPLIPSGMRRSKKKF